MGPPSDLTPHVQATKTDPQICAPRQDFAWVPLQNVLQNHESHLGKWYQRLFITCSNRGAQAAPQSFIPTMSFVWDIPGQGRGRNLSTLISRPQKCFIKLATVGSLTVPRIAEHPCYYAVFSLQSVESVESKVVDVEIFTSRLQSDCWLPGWGGQSDTRRHTAPL